MNSEAAALKPTPKRTKCEWCDRRRKIRYEASFYLMCSLECVNEYRESEGFPPVTAAAAILRG